MINLNRITTELGLYILAFALAVGVRLLHLGAAPLSEFEASWALQALNISRGDLVNIGPNPGYVSLTGLAFFLFGSSNFLARFWPAIVGSLLIWLPFSFRRNLGQKVALVLAFGLSIDPGLVALSRLVGGPMLAIGFGLLALGFYNLKKPVLAGISVGLALLSGPAILHGMVGLGLAYLCSRLLFRWKPGISFEENESFPHIAELGKPLFISAILTILFVGSLFFNYPQGLSALAGTIPDTLNIWFDPSGIPTSRVFLAPIIYQPFAIFFMVLGAMRLLRGNSFIPGWLYIWFITALTVALIFPGRQVSDLGWVLIPLWSLAAIEITHLMRINDWEKVPVYGQASLLFLLLGLGWFNLSALSLHEGDVQSLQLRLAVIGGTIGFGVITTILVAMGWSPSVAKRGLALGVGFSLGLYVIANMWGVSQLRKNGEQELWHPAPYIRQADLLTKTMSDISEWHTGHRQHLRVFIITQGDSLRWLLRDWNEVIFLDGIPSDELPYAIITSLEQPEPQLGVSYAGQDFSWFISPAWEGSLPLNWTHWLVFRNSPKIVERIILWVRTDVLPGGSLEFREDSEQLFEFEAPLETIDDQIPEIEQVE
jgi:hypothetical protein